jgi:predicted transcriptional regulator
MNWNASPAEYDLAAAIAHRARSLLIDSNAELSQFEATEYFLSTLMDVIEVHLNSCPLQLAALLQAPNFDFVHDVTGIRRHLNRQTGELQDCFLPRYAQHSPTPSAGGSRVSS